MQQQTLPAHTGVARFMDACYLREPDATPVWFMRQAGRSLAEYRAIRDKHDILTIAKTPELCTEVTLLPVQLLGVDGAVLLADIVVPLEGMGISVELRPDVGPIIHNPVRTMKDVEALRIIDAEESTGYIMQAIRMVKHELNGKQAVIGFSGSPFTLACYIIEGRPTREYALAKGMMYGQPEVWHALMSKLTEVVSRYLVAQIRAGADVVQLFDSWVGMLSPSTYRKFVKPYVTRIFEDVKRAGAPSIHFGTGAAALIQDMKEAGGDIMSVDWRMDIDDAWAQIGYDRGIQGNLDPSMLLTDWPTIEAGVRDILRRTNNRPGHIFNLGHGVPAPTNPDMLKRIVDAVHEETRRS